MTSALLSVAVSLLCLTSLTTHATAQATQPAAFSHDTVIARAKELAAGPPLGVVPLPASLRQITYDDYRNIRFRPERTIWGEGGEGGERGDASQPGGGEGGLPFQLQLFHLGSLFEAPVTMHLVESGQVKPLDFDPSLFRYDHDVSDKLGPLPDTLGYAGLRLHYPLNRREYHDEVISFLGASYFRVLGRGQQYGASARGLAVDIGLNRAEEFPAFREFWIEQPAGDATSITLHAILESSAVVGAYQFFIEPPPIPEAEEGVTGPTAPGVEPLMPGEEAQTVVRVEATLFFRHGVSKVGIAPLTSMFYFGEDFSRRPGTDFRPEVHDSDGLLLLDGQGRWTWRPLRNPERTSVQRYAMTNPRGFGLMQRDRDFDHYQDLESIYHRRPSVWVEPVGDWGEGRVELLEIPARDEFADNIAAYWVPAGRVDPSSPLTIGYNVYAASIPPAGGGGGEGSVARVVATRSQPVDPDTRRFLIDFEGGPLADMPADAPPDVIAARIDAGVGHAGDAVLQRNPFNGSWRLFFDVSAAAPGEAVDLRASLEIEGRVVSEIWSMRWTP